MERKFPHTDEVLELMYVILALNDANSWPITGQIQIIPVRPLVIMDENLIGK